MNGLAPLARIGLVVILAVATVVLPVAAPLTPLTWGLLPLVAIAVVTVQFGWKARLALVPAMIALSSGAFLAADVRVPDVLVLAGMMVVAWLLLSMLRAAVQRGIDMTVRERRSVERSRDLLATMAELVTLDPGQTVSRVADAIVSLGYPLVSVGEVVGGRIHDIEVRGIPPGMQLNPLPVTEGLAGAAVTHQRAMFVDDYHASPYRTSNAPAVPIGAAMALPIVLDGESVGAVTASRPTAGAIDEQDRRYFEAVGAQAARALDLARRYRAEQQVAERLAEFERLKLGFLGSVTADIRGPLSVIRGLANTLQTNSQAMQEGDAEHLLQRINDAVDRLDRMIEALLDFSRTPRTSTEAHAAVPLADLAERAVATTRTSFPTHHVAMVSEGPCLVDGDPALLEQAISHLVDNACRHTAAGSHVEVEVAGHAGIVTFRVTDDGPGLPTAVAEAIRVGAVGELHGTLGFTLVSHILAAHQARLELPEVEHGTTIGFTLAATESGLGRMRTGTAKEVAR